MANLQGWANFQARFAHQAATEDQCLWADPRKTDAAWPACISDADSFFRGRPHLSQIIDRNLLFHIKATVWPVQLAQFELAGRLLVHFSKGPRACCLRSCSHDARIGFWLNRLTATVQPDEFAGGAPFLTFLQGGCPLPHPTSNHSTPPTNQHKGRPMRFTVNLQLWGLYESSKSIRALCLET